ncbi:hypothetical protein PM082_015177 [Marasmius tenuissimus]|nr:hypothetical protein PM082_015177 [Marasmius tenuissimus]
MPPPRCHQRTLGGDASFFEAFGAQQVGFLNASINHENLYSISSPRSLKSRARTYQTFTISDARHLPPFTANFCYQDQPYAVSVACCEVAGKRLIWPSGRSLALSSPISSKCVIYHNECLRVAINYNH